MNERMRIVCECGSVASAAMRIGHNAAAEAMHDLAQSAPEEIRGHWPHVLAWQRFQLIYEDAAAMGDTKTMMDATERAAKLVASVY